MKLGLVCISEILKKNNNDWRFRTMTRKQFNSLGRSQALRTLSERILTNVKVMDRIVRHCRELGIAHYRISSNLFPLVTDQTLNIDYKDLPDLGHILAQLCAIASDNDISFSTHPDQFNVLPSLNPDTVQRTVLELNHQARVMDWMNLPKDHSAPMCLHLGLSPKAIDEVPDFIERFYQAFEQCDEGVRNRLVLENEDKGYWNCQNLYDTFGGNFPLVYDNLHDQCNPSDDANYCDLFASTWGAFNPVFHWSEGIDGTRKHTAYFSHVPKVVVNNPQITWECEVKAKDFAIKNVLTPV